MKLFLLVLLMLPALVNAQAKITYAFADEAWMPMIYQEEGVYRGLYIEILKAVFEQELNLKLNYSAKPWKRAQWDVEKGQADFMLTVATPSRLKYATPSNAPFFKLYLNVYTYQNHPKLPEIRRIKTSQDIKRLGLVPVSNAGNDWHKSNIDSVGIKTKYMRVDDSVVHFLAMQRADIMVEAVVPMNFLIKKYGLESKVTLTEAQFGPLEFHLLLSKKSPYSAMMPEINAAFEKLMSNNTMQKIFDRYEMLEPSILK